ncbi:magnesium transporter [Romboutsia ilealis]|uniref:magnesium transporter n=1 Tax=Romboutsia ilealis TaxID=1115758 RepID=UPI0025B79622|nr:magnesium transporter [Romboutsia ilealis]
MDRKQDASKDLLSEVTILIENNKILELRELLEEYHIIDIFDIMENLEENNKIKLFEVLPLDMAASILEESDVEFFSNLLSKLDTEHKKNILELMSLDDMADILSQLKEDEREDIMELLSQKDAEDVKELLIYEEESTGGIMTTGYVQINEYMTVKEAISHMREYAEDAETIYYVYVVDNEERLVGVLSLRELIVAREGNIVKDLMSENIISVFVDEDREEAVRLVSKYNLIAIPVIDREHKLKGIITVDDIIDVMEEEATEDMYKFAGTSEQERDIVQNLNKTPAEQIFSSVRARIPWLIITLLAGLLSSAILSNLDFIINLKYASLIFFIPVVLGMGGNIGTQSSALAVMSLSNKDLDFNNVIREAVVGIITGIICSLIVSIIVFIFIKDINIVLVVTISLFINMIVGAMIGGFMPILFKKLDVDPSIISAPVIATVLDITGITIYLVTTSIILSKIA